MTEQKVVKFADGLERTYETWRRLVDAHVTRICGLTLDDLPDQQLRMWYDQAMHHEVAARKVVRMARQD